jgi:RNA polymerase sigma-70 factor, ECF subfamily
MNENIDKQEEISLERLKAGDRAAFARLVEENSPQIYRVALKILGDEQDAEDVLQETFIKAMRSLSTFEGRSSLSTWLYRIAANEALMIVRKRRPDTISIDAGTGLDEDEAQSEPVEIVDWCCLPEGDFMTAEARQFLDEAAQRLSPALRAVFFLRDVEGLSVKDTAEALDISEAAVKTRLLRARLKLREELSVYFAERVSERSNDE